MAVSLSSSLFMAYLYVIHSIGDRRQVPRRFTACIRTAYSGHQFSLPMSRALVLSIVVSNADQEPEEILHHAGDRVSIAGDVKLAFVGIISWWRSLRSSPGLAGASRKVADGTIRDLLAAGK